MDNIRIVFTPPVSHILTKKQVVYQVQSRRITRVWICPKSSVRTYVACVASIRRFSAFAGRSRRPQKVDDSRAPVHARTHTGVQSRCQIAMPTASSWGSQLGTPSYIATGPSPIPTDLRAMYYVHHHHRPIRKSTTRGRPAVTHAHCTTSG